MEPIKVDESIAKISGEYESQTRDGIAGDGSSIQRGGSNRDRKSIIGHAKQNIFEFPVFVADAVPLEYATAISSLLEQVYASFLQMAISAKPLVSGEQIKQGRQFSHLKTDTNRYLEFMDDARYLHDACHNKIIGENGFINEFELISYDDETARVFNEYLDHEPLSEFSHFIQEEDLGREKFNYQQGQDSKQDTRQQSEDAYKRQRDYNDDMYKAKQDLIKQQNDDRKFGYQIKRDNIQQQRQQDEDAYNRQKDIADDVSKYAPYYIDKEYENIENLQKQLDDLSDDDPQVEVIKGSIEDAQERIKKLNRDPSVSKEIATSNKIEIDRSKEIRDRMVKSSEMLKYQDIQKLNTMKPLMMTVRLRRDEFQDSEPFEFVVGVKCHMRLVPSNMMPEVAEYPLKEMNKISRHIRWKAGELKFFKDILFKIPQRKQTAVDSKDPNRKWFRRLYDLSHSKGDSFSANAFSSNKSGPSLTGLFDMKNFDGGVIPNASIIITKGVVDDVKSKTGIDLLSPRTALNFSQELFLISFIVVDIDAESIKVLLPDLHSDFEIHSLASINKAMSTLDTVGVKTREMFKIL